MRAFRGASVRAKLMFLAPLLLLVVLVSVSLRGGHEERTAVAYFGQVKGLYVGDDVLVLGVKVGTVTEIIPGPTRVRVEFQFDVAVPADVKAVITAPSLVPVRNLTLTPAYEDGPRLADGAEIPESRTAVPVEWDEIKKQVDEVARALGPRGANGDGALNRALATTAANLNGQGPGLRQTISALSEAMATLADNRGAVFGTVRNLLVFAEALQSADSQVDQFNRQLASVAHVLGARSEDLGTAITGMDRAFGEITQFLKDNRGELGGAVRDLQPLAQVLAENRQSLADILQAAPVGLSNFYGIYDPIDGSLTANLAAANLQAPAVMICSAMLDLGATRDDCYRALGPLAKALTLAPPGVGIGALERNGRSNQVYARPGPEPAPGSAGARPDLAGIRTGGVR